MLQVSGRCRDLERGHPLEATQWHPHAPVLFIKVQPEIQRTTEPSIEVAASGMGRLQGAMAILGCRVSDDTKFLRLDDEFRGVLGLKLGGQAHTVPFDSLFSEIEFRGYFLVRETFGHESENVTFTVGEFG